MRASLPLLALLATAPALAQPLALESPDPQRGGYFGLSVSGVPDADGDGAGDLLVGAPDEDTSVGRAYVFSGASGDLLHTLESANPEQSGDFGWSVSGVADADGDGRGDLLVGAPFENVESQDYAGRAYVFSGASGDLLHTVQSPNPEFAGYFGWSVSGVADADGDGRGDLLVGAENEVVDQGRAYLFSGATGALLRILESPNPQSEFDVLGFGGSVAGVADADGDGRGDLLVGSYGEGIENQGRAYVFSGASGALLHSLVSPNVRPHGYFGISVAGVADADGDGRGDLLVGAANEGLGRAYLFSGARGRLLYALEPGLPVSPGSFGSAVAGVPDLDGDGRGELGVAATGDLISPPTVPPEVHVFSGATGEQLFTLRPPAFVPGVISGYGFAIAGVGDLDGDGRGDGVIGAPFMDVGGMTWAGAAYRYRTDGRFDGRWEAAGEVVGGEPSSVPPALALAVGPNPLTSATAVRVGLPRPSEVVVEVLDVLGRRVAVVHDGALAAGIHALRWAPERGLPGGVYLVRLRVEGEPVQTQRVTLAR